MPYSNLVSETKFSDIEIQFARLLRQAATTGTVDKACQQYAQVIADHYGINLNASDSPLANEIPSQPSDEDYVIQQLQLSEAELRWSSLDTLKLNNQARRFQQLYPLNPDGSLGDWNNSSLYPSSRDHIRWEVMRKQGIQRSQS